MNTEIVKAESFEDKLKNRIRDSIGELLSDEDLSKMIHRATEDIFFNKRKIGSGWQEKEAPPLIQELIKESIQSRIDIAIELWMVAHNAEIISIFKEMMDKGLLNCIFQGFSRTFTKPFAEFMQDITNRVTHLDEQIPK